jgi:hypothetical protein
MTPEEIEQEIQSLKLNSDLLQQRQRELEEMIDTLWTPPWKKVLFALDGWPLYRLAERPQWRPWRRWWTS